MAILKVKDGGVAKTVSIVQPSVPIIIPVSGDTGTLFSYELDTLKADKRAMIERDNVIYQYASILSDGKMRYTVVNSFLGGIDYLCTILVDATTGEWEYEYERIYMCKYSNVPPTTVPNPSGVSGPFFYSIVNDIIHIQWDGVSVSSAGTLYVWNQFPSQYLPKQNKQRCVPGIDFNSGYANCFLYVNPTGVRMKAWRTGTAYWGCLSYHLDF